MAYNKFVPLRQISGNDFKIGLLDRSQTISNGEVIIPSVRSTTNVLITGGSTTGALLGVVHALLGKNGQVLELDSKATAADNETVAMIQAEYLPLFIDMEFGATLDADKETTGGSGTYGSFAVDSTGLLLSESSVVTFATVIAKQFFSFGINPGTTRDVSGYFTKKIGYTA